MIQGRLTAHGWYYDILSGRMERYDEEMRLKFPRIEGVPGETVLEWIREGRK